MWTSISAIENAGGKHGDAGCLRRWWFAKCLKLPQPKTKATAFGDVFHAVQARYLSADDRGLVNGKPVDLYPADWMSQEEKFGPNKGKIYTISNEEASLIQILTAEAISKGVLIRSPGRRIEQQLGEYMYTDKETKEKQYGRILLTEGRVHKTKVVLKGFIDYEDDNRIEDHKTAKDTKYALSKAKLHKSIQMMTYAYDKYERGHEGTLWLAHNNFIKDFDRPQVIKREIEVTKEEVYQFYLDVTLPLVKNMFKIYLYYTQDKMNLWRDVSPPNNPNQECNYYYGRPCPYINICSGNCSIETYLAGYGQRINKIEGQYKQERLDKKMGNKLIESIKAEQEKLTGSRNATTITGAVPQQQPELTSVHQTSTTPPATEAPKGGIAGIVARFKKPEVQQPQQETAPAPVQQPQQVAPAPVPTQPAQVTQAVQPTEEKQVAPWYVEVNGQPCPACSENEVPGYNSSTPPQPCRICNVRAKQQGIPTSSDYDVSVEDGKLVFTLKQGKNTEVVINNPATPTNQVTLAQPAETKIQSETVQEQKIVTPQETTILNKAQQQKINIGLDISKSPEATGFTLLIGCSVVKGAMENVVLADDLLKAALDYVAEVAGQETSTIDHFQLMAALDAYIPEFIPNLQGVTVVSFAATKGSALARLLDGLRPYASQIITAMTV